MTSTASWSCWAVFVLFLGHVGAHSESSGGPAAAECVIDNKIGDWYLGMRVRAGSGDSPYNMWLGDAPVNDDDSTCNSWTVSSEITASLKSRYTELLWQDITEVRIAVYTNGQLKAYIDFNAVGATKDNFMSQSRILRSSYTDIKTASSQYFSVEGCDDGRVIRRFYAQHLHAGCPGDLLWMAEIDTRVKQYCPWEQCGPQPCFMYSPLTTFSSSDGLAIADVFAVLYRTTDCSPGLWGLDCRLSCHCANNAACRRDSGQCPGACAPGWAGDVCDDCDVHYWGATCHHRCYCASGATCDTVSGSCSGGCAAGWTGHSCSEAVCAAGTGGSGCTNQCVCTNGASCLPHNRGQSLTPDPNYPRDCADIKVSNRCATSGVYHIYPNGFNSGLEVYCDMETDAGGWTLIQRRECNCVDFSRNWTEYANGFGCLKTEHWLGNRHIFHLTNTNRPMALRVDLEDWSCPTVVRFAEYKTFSVADEDDKFRLQSTGYRGNTGDAMTYHSGVPFSTIDRDNDNHDSDCASASKGAWWYNSCHHANLNGLYHTGGVTDEYGTGIVWKQWMGYHYSLKKSEMKIRPNDF